MVRKSLLSLIMMALIAIPFVSAPVQAVASQSATNEQTALLHHYSIRPDAVVIDSAMSREQALGDAVVPAEGKVIHETMKPLLRVVPVIYHGFDKRIHVGQIVVHKSLVGDTSRTFWKMFQLGFPIKSVIPQSKFGYNDTASMAANNSSGYRPEDGSEHGRAAAIDINPVQNPFDLSAYDGRPIEPAGATYDPNKPGTITKDGAVRKYWTSLNWEWGGGWGDPNATPPTDFYKVGYFDYQHFQLNYTRYDSFVATLPSCMQDWTCGEK